MDWRGVLKEIREKIVNEQVVICQKICVVLEVICDDCQQSEKIVIAKKVKEAFFIIIEERVYEMIARLGILVESEDCDWGCFWSELHQVIKDMFDQNISKEKFYEYFRKCLGGESESQKVLRIMCGNYLRCDDIELDWQYLKQKACQMRMELFLSGGNGYLEYDKYLENLLKRDWLPENDVEKKKDREKKTGEFFYKIAR